MIKFFKESDLEQDLNTGQKLYIYFHSPTCGPCKITTPLVQEFGNATLNVVYMVNSREGKELQKQLDVSAYPSMIIVHNNKVIKGGIGQNEVQNIIKNETSNN